MVLPIVLEVVLILVLVIINGLLAMSEMALVSAKKSRLQQSADRGSRRAAVALKLANDPDRFLPTVQIGITLVGILAGAFSGATIAEQLDARLEAIPSLSRYSELIAFGVVVLSITYLSLVVGELVPKRIALNNADRIATAAAPAMAGLSRFSAPLVAILGASTRAALWLLRIRLKPESPVTEEDLRLLLSQGARAGTILQIEQTVVERVFRLGDRNVKALMTPRQEVEWLDLSTPIDDLRRQVLESTHSNFPVAEGSLDGILGMTQSKQLWAAQSSEALRIQLMQPLFVPANMRAFALLELFRTTRIHLAVVIDEFAAMQGIVTPNDILQALVGTLPEPGTETQPMIVERDDGSWLVDAFMDMEDVTAVIRISQLPGQKKGAYQTLAGWFIDRLGRIPRESDYVEADQFRFEVVDMDGRRVDKILIAPARADTRRA